MTKLKEIVAPLASRESELLKLTLEFADINSGSFNALGLEEMAKALLPAFLDLGCKYEIYALPDFSQITQDGKEEHHTAGPLLRFWKRPEANKQVLLVGHFDTVYGADHPFQASTRIAENKINGPGVADMKGGIVVMKSAIDFIEQREEAKDLGWEVLLTPDEEIGSPGSAQILADRAKNHQFGLVFEPSINEQGGFAGDRKGSGRFTFVVSGKAAHAGRNFNLGRNAIYKMATLVENLYAMNGKREGVTLNIGRIHGGGAVNVVPDKCVCWTDIRYNDLSDEIWVRDNLDQQVKLINEDSDYKVDLFGGFGRKPKKIQGETEKLYELLRVVGDELSLPVEWQATGGCCDGNNLASAGLPNVDTLGVRGGNIHSSDEYLMIDSLVERAQLTASLLMKIASLE